MLSLSKHESAPPCNLLQLFHRDRLAAADRSKLLHVGDRPAEDVAGARQPRLAALGDRRAAEADGDRIAVGPEGDLARRDDGAGVRVALHADRGGEINLLAPGHRLGGEGQGVENRVCRRRVEQLDVDRDLAHGDPDASHGPFLARIVAGREGAGFHESAGNDQCPRVRDQVVSTTVVPIEKVPVK